MSTGDETKSPESESDTNEKKPKAKRGFAVMDPALRSEIARRGGKAAHKAGTAHEFTPHEAREAGKKGAARMLEKYGKDFMIELGKLGGAARRKKAEATSE